MASLGENLKNHPVASLVVAVGAIAGALLAILTFTGELDAMVVSEPELQIFFDEHEQHPHAAAQQQIDAWKDQSSCESIDIRIAILEDQIYRMEQDNPDSQRLVDKRRELRNLESKRRNLNCARFG